MSTELEEALGAVTATTGASLIQKYIDPLILEYVRRYSPLLSSLPSKRLVGTNAYNWVTRTALPDGGATSDGGARSLSSSTWTQSPTAVKNYQSLGGVTGFAQAVTGVISDLQRSEIDGAMKSLMWAVETSLIFANDGATLGVPAQTSAQGVVNGGPDMRGLDYQVNSYSGTTQNAIDYANTGLNRGVSGGYGLSVLDQLIDLVEENAAQPLGPDWQLLMSPKMASAVNQALVNQQRFNNGTTFAGGISIPSYRDCDIVKSSFLAARSQQMGTVTPTTSTTGGTLAAATYRYQVSAVINRFGEIAGSTDVTQVTTGSTSTVTLSFSTPTGPDSNGPILYKVFRSTGGAGTAVLIGVVAPFDDTGAAVTSVVDTGTNLLLNGRTQSQLVNAGYPSTYQDGNAGQFARATGSEDIYLIPKTDDFIVRPYVRDFFAKELAQVTTAPDVMPFYVASDTALAVRAPKYVARASRVSVSL